MLHATEKKEINGKWLHDFHWLMAQLAKIAATTTISMQQKGLQERKNSQEIIYRK